MNMRIDIIRKELERRFKQIDNFPDKTSLHKLIDSINPFLHSLIMEPALRSFIIDLSQSTMRFKLTEKYTQIRKAFINSLKVIVSIINTPDFIDELFRNELNKQMNFSSFTFVQNVTTNDNDLCEQFLNGLANFKDHFDSAVTEDSLGRILGTIGTIHGRGKEHDKFCDDDRYNKEYNSLLELINELRANMQLRAQYEGADSLNVLLPVYLKSSYKYLSGLREEDFGDYMSEAVYRTTIAEISGTGIVEDCRNVYHAVDKFLSTSKSKSFVINRLITYCTWIRRRDFPKSGEENKERKISTIIEEFIFDHGYFPIVRFKAGKSEPDILTAPGIDLRWDNSVLIELKQIIGETSYSAASQQKDIGQAQDYLQVVKGINPDVVDVVHLLIFYDGKTRRTVHKSVDVPDNVRVEFVYVGEESPSKLKSTKGD
jgi:hypothetical protein